MTRTTFDRRHFLAGSAAVSTLAVRTRPAHADASDVYEYSVTRTEEEWHARLSDVEYHVLREGGTEARRSSPLWNVNAPGTYCCRGCDLTLYDSVQRIELDIGWVFFGHSRPDTVMTGLDLLGGTPGDPDAETNAMMEAHCRRCGSHLGHIVAVPDMPERPIHCINGISLRFEATAA